MIQRRIVLAYSVPTLLVMLVACGDAASGDPSDAGVQDAASDAGADACGEQCGPAPPTGAALEACPDRLLAVDGFSAGGLCQPAAISSTCGAASTRRDIYSSDDTTTARPEDLAGASVCVRTAPPASCPAGSRPSPATGSCEPWSQPCLEDGLWPEDAALRASAPDAPGAIVYVATDGPVDGNGTRERPYASIGEALRNAEPGGIVALGAGRYAEQVTVRDGVWLVGACTDATIIEAPAASSRPTLQFAANSSGGIASLQFQGAAPAAMCSAGAECGVRDVLIDGAAGTALSADGADAQLVARGVWIRGTAPAADGTGAGTGVVAQRGGRVDLSDTVIAASTDWSLVVSGASAILDAVTISGADATTPSVNAGGVFVSGDAQLDGQGVVVVGVRSVGVQVDGSGAVAHLVDSAVLATEPQPGSGRFGRGVGVQNGGRVELEGSVIADHRANAVYVSGEGSTALLLASYVLSTDGQEVDDMLGTGINAVGGAQVELRDVLVVGNRSAGVYASGEGTSMTLDGCTVASTRPRASDSDQGLGVGVFEGASLRVTETRISHNTFVGCYVDGVGTTADLSDVVIAHTAPRVVDETIGVGLVVARGAVATVDGALVTDSVWTAVLVDGDGTEVDLTDVVVTRTSSSAVDGTFGRGINVQNGAVLRGERMVVSEHRSTGIFAASVGTVLHLVDVAVLDTFPAACADDGSCAGGGTGIAIVDGATLALERFSIGGSALAGLQVARDAAVTASEGVLEANAIGVNVQVPSLDLDQAFVDVRLVGNERNVASEDLPIPGPIGALPLLEP